MLGFISSQTSGRIYRVLAEREGIETGFMTKIDGRTPFTHFFSNRNKSTRIGPLVTTNERESFMKTLCGAISNTNRNDPPLVILSGSMPPFDDGSQRLFYRTLILMVRKIQQGWPKKSQIWVDAKWGRGLQNAMHVQPDFVKFNHVELGDIPECACGERSWIRTYFQRLLGLSTQYRLSNIGVTLGPRGALRLLDGAVAEYVRLRKKIPDPEPAGCGDTFFAATAAHFMGCLPTFFSHFSGMEVGVAAASATARKPGTNLVESILEIKGETRNLMSHRFFL